ncbi:hypothetical protein H5P28_17815 [Ruficoccus amylovorans]|uniref:Uncharacterized protein n=1 Tax=Ruficoccus amylovorans TaxID=1804625 RepID=A0A842HIE4_9BACT|nr:hypothetical protein [Ruficoccus amylovorans]MBC2596129.1 hypothetical protein [Ruficoccus amylovorans]
MKRTLPTLLASFLLTSLTPFTLHADSLTVEGDLKVEASGTAQGDLTVDNKFTVNPGSGVKAALTVEPNGVIWAGSAEGYDTTNEVPVGYNVRLMWIPQKSTFRGGLMYDDEWTYDDIGDFSFAFGDGVSVRGNASVAFGRWTGASGSMSSAWGDGSSASGARATAWGEASRASGELSTASGYLTLAGGNTATSWGIMTVANGYGSMVWGDGSMALGGSTTAWGKDTVASGDGSTAWGGYVTARAKFSTAMGRFNIGEGNGVEWLELDPLLEIGNGSSDVNPSNALTIIKNGQTTLKNKYWDEQNPTEIPDDPDTTLAGDQSSAGEALVVKGHTNLNGNLTVQGNVTMPRQGDILMGAFQ